MQPNLEDIAMQWESNPSTVKVRPNYKPTIKDILLLIFRDGLFFSYIPTLLYIFLGGWLVTIIGIIFRHEAKPGTNPASQGVQYEGWKDIQGPKWLWILFNDEVGCMGDSYWPARIPVFLQKLGVKSTSHPVAMWYWISFRNPLNNLQQLIGQNMTLTTEIDYRGDIVVDDSAEIRTSGAHFVKCKSDGKTTYSFFLVKRYKRFPNKCLRIRWGYKVKPDVNVNKKIALKDKVGTVGIIHPWKTFGAGEEK